MKTLDEESIFLNAIDIHDEDERSRYVQDCCPEDREMHDKVAQLVAMHFSKGRILDETQASQAVPDTATVAEIGTMVGAYKLLQEIGEGGMGIVFMAEQSEPIRRKVAVKIIKVGMDTRRVVARFESERQAMALMDHPNITRVLDAGATESGRPYFVMELVRGQSITEYCDEKRFALRQRLRLFVQVCNALEHAHQKGIIHRDIKPTNIMVTNHDGVPVPKIIDFGIAKAIDESLTDKTLFTRYGEMVGTPLYMSPEQAEMSEPDVDTRADIYSLGVVLYELLTGTTPFHDLSKNSFHEIRDAIRSSDPQLASTRINNLGNTVNQVSLNRDTDVRSLHHHLKGELDWILMKCLSRDRNQRYQSAGELSREIDRYLNGEPIDAAAPTIRYRMQKFVTKHKGAVAVATCFALLLMASSLFSTMMAIKANRAENVASAKCRELVKERDRAVAAEQRLAELERQQRNRVAIHQAASKHNANVVKRFLANPGELASVATNTGSPRIEVKQMGKIWNASTLRSVPHTASFRVNADGDGKLVTGERVSTAIALTGVQEGHEDEGIEVIIVTGEGEHQESLLKSILKNQRAAFGDKDIVVAQTLKHLGELMSDKQEWEESEDYFREAFEILKDKAADNPQFLSEIRVRLIDSLRKQGHLEKAVAELRDLKINLDDVELPEKLSEMMGRLKIEVQQVEEDEKDR